MGNWLRLEAPPRIAIARLALLALAIAAFLGAARPACAQPAAVQGTDFTLFWRGDLRIVATRPNTLITVIDASTGAILSPTLYTANVAVNPIDLRNQGD